MLCSGFPVQERVHHSGGEQDQTQEMWMGQSGSPQPALMVGCTQWSGWKTFVTWEGQVQSRPSSTSSQDNPKSKKAVSNLHKISFCRIVHVDKMHLHIHCKSSKGMLFPLEYLYNL